MGIQFYRAPKETKVRNYDRTLSIIAQLQKPYNQAYALCNLAEIYGINKQQVDK